jgi:hypothetical protein
MGSRCDYIRNHFDYAAEDAFLARLGVGRWASIPTASDPEAVKLVEGAVQELRRVSISDSLKDLGPRGSRGE